MSRIPFIVSIALLVTGCARVIVPPRVELEPYEVVGIVEFKCNEQGKLGPAAARSFVQDITRDQLGIRIVELGPQSHALAAVNEDVLGPAAYKALGEKYELKTIFTGELSVSDVEPRISIGPGLDFASFSAEVEATLVARLVETATGATVWTGSATDRKTIGGVSKFGAAFAFDARDPEIAYGELTRALVRKATRDFRSTRHYRGCRCR